MYFLTFTNGTLLDEPLVGRARPARQRRPAISVEGYREQTDRRRGAGVYEKVLARHGRCSGNAGVVFGVSVTYTSENVEEVTSDEFIEHCIDSGAIFAWYFMFMPVGKDPVLELVPTPEQRVACGTEDGRAAQKLPDLPGRLLERRPGRGRLPGRRPRYLHILNSGRVEPCVFAHFGVDNIREKTHAGGGELAVLQGHPARVSVQRERQPEPAVHDHRQPPGAAQAGREHLVPRATNTPRTSSGPGGGGVARSLRGAHGGADRADLAGADREPSVPLVQGWPEYKNLFRFQTPDSGQPPPEG